MMSWPSRWSDLARTVQCAGNGLVISERARNSRTESQQFEAEHRLLIEAVQCAPVAMAVYTAQDKLLCMQ